MNRVLQLIQTTYVQLSGCVGYYTTGPGSLTAGAYGGAYAGAYGGAYGGAYAGMHGGVHGGMHGGAYGGLAGRQGSRGHLGGGNHAARGFGGFGGFNEFNEFGGFDEFGGLREDFEAREQGLADARVLETQKLELLKHACYVPLRLEPEPAPAAPEVTLTTGVVALHEDCVYCGQLLAGVPQGEGRLLCPSAREVVYEGGFADGVFEGEGRRFFENEETERGVFHAGLLVRGRRIHADGSIFVGEFADGVPCGQGRYVLPSGVYIEGQWEKGKPKGVVKVRVPTQEAEITYDLAHPDEDTVITLRFCESFLLFKDNHFASEMVPTFLFFFNGDVFVGTTKHEKEPSSGFYFRFASNKYMKLVMGGGCAGIGISDIDYVDNGLVKSIVFKA